MRLTFAGAAKRFLGEPKSCVRVGGGSQFLEGLAILLLETQAKDTDWVVKFVHERKGLVFRYLDLESSAADVCVYLEMQMLRIIAWDLRSPRKLSI